MALKHRRVHTRVKLGLEEDEITWYSNETFFDLSSPLVWEAEEITRFSNQDCSRGGTYPGLKENKITWCSNYNRKQALCVAALALWLGGE